MEKRKLLCTAGENVNWFSHYGKQYGGSSKHYKYNCHTIQQSHFCMYPKEMKSLSWRDICTAMFVLTLNIQSKDLSIHLMWLLGSSLYRSSLVIIYHFSQRSGSDFRSLLLLWATDHSFISLEWVSWSCHCPTVLLHPQKGHQAFFDSPQCSRGQAVTLNKSLSRSPVSSILVNLVVIPCYPPDHRRSR